MTDTARDYLTQDPSVTIEGLDELFLTSDTSTQARTDSLDISPDSDDTQAQATSDSLDTFTVQEAADLLKVSPRTILRRLNKGTLSGFKVDGMYGQEWRVSLDSSDNSAQARTDSLDISPDSDDTQAQATSDSLDTTAKGPSDALVSELRDQLAALKAELNQERSESQRLLQAAAFRNGYLESQLTNKTEEIKLLTDSQHKSGAWRRFCNWFFGQ